MRVVAVVDFGGQYAMRKGAEADLPDDPVTRCLVADGFLREVKEKAPKPKNEKPAGIENPAEEEPGQDLHQLKVAELIEMCKEKGVAVKGKAKKEDLIKALEA